MLRVCILHLTITPKNGKGYWIYEYAAGNTVAQGVSHRQNKLQDLMLTMSVVGEQLHSFGQSS